MTLINGSKQLVCRHKTVAHSVIMCGCTLTKFCMSNFLGDLFFVEAKQLHLLVAEKERKLPIKTLFDICSGTSQQQKLWCHSEWTLSVKKWVLKYFIFVFRTHQNTSSQAMQRRLKNTLNFDLKTTAGSSFYVEYDLSARKCIITSSGCCCYPHFFSGMWIKSGSH